MNLFPSQNMFLQFYDFRSATKTVILERFWLWNRIIDSQTAQQTKTTSVQQRFKTVLSSLLNDHLISEAAFQFLFLFFFGFRAGGRKLVTCFCCWNQNLFLFIQLRVLKNLYTKPHSALGTLLYSKLNSNFCWSSSTTMHAHLAWPLCTTLMGHEANCDSNENICPVSGESFFLVFLSRIS